MCALTRLLVLAVLAALPAGAPRRVYAQTPAVPPAPTTRPASDSATRPLALDAPEVVRSIGPGEEHAYTVVLHAGMFARAVVDQRGVDVIVRVVAPDGTQVVEVDSPNGDTGLEPVAFEAATAGTYRLLVRVFPNGSRQPGATYAARLTGVQSAAERAAEVAAAGARTDTVVRWLAANAVPIRSVTAGSGFADLEPLKPVLRDARIVGLGEATHGSREFFQFKHRMLEFLVRELGFRVFAIEASLAAAENVIDPYVQGGPGEPGPVLESQGFWTWNTEEVRDLLAWLRTYNASVPPAERVRFVGIDLQVNDEARRTVLAYLRRVAPGRVPQTEALIAVKVDSLAGAAFMARDTAAASRAYAQVVAAGRGYTELAAFLAANERRFAAQTSTAEAARAVRHARVLAQHADVYGQPLAASGAVRDRYMAENLRHFLDGAPAGTRVVLWAHNGHIAHAPAAGIERPLGDLLREAYGRAYYAVGFSFGGGAFQARDADPNAAQPYSLTEFRIGAPAEGSVDWTLGRAAERLGAPVVFVDLRRAAPPGAARDWLAEPQGMMIIGSVFQRTWLPIMYTAPTILSQAFDGVVYFRTTTRARPNPSVTNVAGARP